MFHYSLSIEIFIFVRLISQICFLTHLYSFQSIETIISKLFDKIGVRKLAESEAKLRRKTPEAKAMRAKLKTDQARLAGKIDNARSICLLCLESSDSGSDSDSESDSDSGDASYAVARVTPAGGLPYGRQSHSHAPRCTPAMQC